MFGKRVCADVMQGSQEEILLDLRYPMPGVWKRERRRRFGGTKRKSPCRERGGAHSSAATSRKHQEPLKLEEEREHSPLEPSVVDF